MAVLQVYIILDLYTRNLKFSEDTCHIFPKQRMCTFSNELE